MEMQTILMIIVAVLLVVLLVLFIGLKMELTKRGQSREMEELADSLDDLRDQAERAERTSEARDSELRREVNEALRSGMKAQSDQLMNTSRLQTETIQSVLRENASQKEAIIATLTTAMDKLQRSNEERLNEIRGVVDKKLDKTLNERLDANFSQVTEQLGKLYRSLGELKDLSGGVADLNRTLSNVKTRGIFGEVQLERVLEQTLSRSQYATNVATKKNSNDRVEFAVRFPSQDEEGRFVYLPIDAKFPSDIYNRIVDAADQNDAEGLSLAQTELKNRIRKEASDIAGKYLDPPNTTAYAFMYLPTEGLYAEVLRIDGLTEECQKKGVIVTGPTTITAVLNSLQAGFRNLALSKKSVEVMRLLEAVKGQVGRMDDAVEKTRKKLNDAVNMTEDLKKRTARLSSRMRSVGEISEEESDALLSLSENDLYLNDSDEE